nr:DUF3781 domain-containing protein [Neglectibacter sp. M00184]
MKPEARVMNDLLQNIALLHTTELGAERIRRNLELSTEDIVSWCAEQILQKDAKLERIGKNWYITVERCRITVNAHSYTIITAHKL